MYVYMTPTSAHMCTEIRFYIHFIAYVLDFNGRA